MRHALTFDFQQARGLADWLSRVGWQPAATPH
jgi:hypothetical protein